MPPVYDLLLYWTAFFKKCSVRRELLAVVSVYKKEGHIKKESECGDMKRYGWCLTVLILCAVVLTLACGSALSEVFLQMRGCSPFLPL